MMTGAEISVHIQVRCKKQWQRLEKNQALIDQLYRLARTLLTADPIHCRADVSCRFLYAPALGGQGFQLGQHQVLRPAECPDKMVSVLLSFSKDREPIDNG